MPPDGTLTNKKENRISARVGQQKQAQTDGEAGQDTYANLPPRYQRAIFLRLLGYPYDMIAADEGVKYYPNYLRELFMKGGACHDAYQAEFKQQKRENSKAFRNLRKRMEELAPAAMSVVEESVKYSKSLGASFNVLSINGISPIEKVDNTDNRPIKIVIVHPGVDGTDSDNTPDT